MEQDRFFAVFCNGEYTFAKSFEILPKNPKTVMYIHAHFDHEHITQGGTCIPWYRFEIIDSNGQPKNYKVGDFEVIHIHPDNGLYNFFGRRIDILDNRLGTIHHYMMTQGSYETIVQDFYHELTEVMMQLHRSGSWLAFNRINELETENARLRK
ncbi:hypothetical protein [Millionella massiliensis]|uniref:hypothetical protein n=1 Tax=Millionella massiliensis TaxID=1871023 RepID=UPI0023A824B1|nr:hypothetical protein [Millionella massiliensis]